MLDIRNSKCKGPKAGMRNATEKQKKVGLEKQARERIVSKGEDRR